jgi:hypothetical protein
VGWVPYRDTARIRATAETPAAPQPACPDAGQSAMAAARLQLRRMAREQAPAVRLTPRPGRGPA